MSFLLFLKFRRNFIMVIRVFITISLTNKNDIFGDNQSTLFLIFVNFLTGTDPFFLNL